MAKKKKAEKSSAGCEKSIGDSAKPDVVRENAETSQEAGSELSKPAAQVDTEKGPKQAGRDKPGFPVVGIGASAGGLEALEELLVAMPADTGMAFVIVTHLHPTHTSMLPELLRKDTDMPVVEAADGLKIEANHVYVEPPGAHLAILNCTLHRMDTGTESAPRLPIDYFFRSLAEDQAERAICIVLSGTGTDGTLGLKAIKGESGMVMVQTPQSAKYAGMPSSAIATGLCDYVLSPAEMPEQMMTYVSGPYIRGGAPGASESVVTSEPLQKMFLLLRSHTGHDFSSYKESTIRRRIERRMNVHQLKSSNHYVRYLQENPHEIDVLFKELLISVTNFFRDPAAFDVLANGPLPELLVSRPDDYAFRAWVPGCATGEEVYSLAILLRECVEKTKRHFGVQIFGTDLDSDAIDSARIGQYPDGIGVDVTPERLDRYFTRIDSSYRIRKEIREMAIFAPQNVIKDPPFTKLDLLSCRNLLIYLNADLQRRLLPIFHYALKPGGLLFLGPSESIGGFGELFETVDKKWKIFRRKETAITGHLMPEMPASMMPPDIVGKQTPKLAPQIREAQMSTLIERKLLSQLCPPSVVINDRGDMIHIQGRTGEYLEMAEGQARTNILDMAREGLPHALAAAIRDASNSEEMCVRENLRVKTNGDFAHVDVSVTRILDPEPIRGLMIVTFQPVSPPPKVEKSKGRGDRLQVDRAQELEKQLQYMKESHQTTLEELETSNEELKSTNEELQSTNEELQSTNEELETSKEEMQSLNEELTTVNAELQSKVEDLSQANDDMQNLLNSTNIATVFLDNELNIKRYTEQATDVVMLRQTDIGRPISELASNLDHDQLLDDCREVLRTLVFNESEVTAKDGTWYLMRIMPYRTSENVIDGVVITFVKIDQLKRAEAGAASGEFFEKIVNTLREPLVVLDRALRVVSCNNSFYTTFQTNAKQTRGRLIYELDGAQWDERELRTLLEEVLPQETSFDNYRVSAEFERIGRRTFLLNARRLSQPAGEDLILLAMEEEKAN